MFDPKGGFFESLDDNGVPVQSTTRSVLTQARLTYVFSHAHCLQATEQSLRYAEHGFRFLQRAAELAGGDCGWHRAITVDGIVIDGERDAYDQAFVILALAWYYRASAHPQALALAERAYGFMDAHLADQQHGGFFEEYSLIDGVQKLPRRQNPHMHLLEAVLAMHQASREPQWLERAKKLVSLFKQHFFDTATGSLVEYFNADWSPAASPMGALREPGHHFEWVWLLHEYFDASGDPEVLDFAQRLFAFGSSYGIDMQGPLAGMVFDGVNADGGLVAGSKLLWPQTECIKACLALGEWRGDAQIHAAAHVHAAAMRRHFFKEDGASWHNQLSRSGAPLQSATPARVLYHLFLAMAELLRCSALVDTGEAQMPRVT